MRTSSTTLLSRAGGMGLALACVLAITPAALAAPAAAPANPLGIQVVRFAAGTTPAAMRQAVTAAGGQVITDLSEVRAMAVGSTQPGLAARLRAQRGVAAVWTDRQVQPTAFTPDPLHDLPSISAEDAPGPLQWDDERMHTPGAWRTTTGSPEVTVAVLDSGVSAGRELNRNIAGQLNVIPCQQLTALFGAESKRLFDLAADCSVADQFGHGTWIAGRIAADDNGIGSNGIAPDTKILDVKVIGAADIALTSWIVDGMLRACDADADILSMSLGGYYDPADPASVDDAFLMLDAVDYCRARGTATIAAAGNEHVRIDRTTITLTGSSEQRTLTGAGVVNSLEGRTATPDSGLAEPPSTVDLGGLLELPAGAPGVVMVSSTGNTIAAPAGNVVAGHEPPPSAVATQDNLAWYSNYGSRVDLAAPGGADKQGVWPWDVRPGTNTIDGGWGVLSTGVKNGIDCRGLKPPFFLVGTPRVCFDSGGQTFTWNEGTSMATPQVAGVAALVLAAHPELRERPDALTAQLTRTANRAPVNHTGPWLDSPDPIWSGAPCANRICHLSWVPIPSPLAYGAGLVDAERAVNAPVR